MSKSHLFGTDPDPSESLAGELADTLQSLQNGVHRVAESNGVTFWAKLLNGSAIDYRAFDGEGRELAVVRYSPPDGEADRPRAGFLRPSKAVDILPGGPVRGNDGGTVCAYVCAALSDGGRICWLECR